MPETERTVSVGDHVEYVDETGAERDALVTAVWPAGGSTAESVDPDEYGNLSANLVIVNSDESMDDQYGRQIERETSQPHESSQGAHGRFWRLPEA